MSWMKHRAVPGSGGSGRPPPTSATPSMPPVQMYNPNQHSNQQLNSQWQQVDLTAPATNTWHDNQQSVQQQNNWHQPQQPTYQAPIQQEHYSNQQFVPYYQQHPQNYPQQSYQQPIIPPQQQNMQPYMNSSSVSNAVDNKSDVWNEWNTWGDEDNSNNMQNVPEETLNANMKQELVEESFASNQSWNWDADEQKAAAALADNDHRANDVFTKVKPKIEPQTVNIAKKEHFMKPVKSETVTPQWSIESQPSQDSSTDEVALLQSDTEQKHIANATTTNSTTTNSSNVPSSVDLTSSSQLSTSTNTSYSVENKEVIDTQSGQINMSGYQQSGSAQQHQSLARPTSVGYRNNSSSNNVQSATLDNIEVPSSTLLQSERNQYLETGQLLGDNIGDNTDNFQAPPPAFSRVVVGQRESNDDVRFGPGGSANERTLPAGSDVGAKTSTYRPRGDSSDEDSAFDDNEPLAPSFPLQPILPRSATIGAETLAPTYFVPLPPQSLIPPSNQTSNNFPEQRDTHLDGANTLDDFNTNLVQDQPLSLGGNVGIGEAASLLAPMQALGGGSSIGEGGSGPEGQEEDSLSLGTVTGGIRQLTVSGGDSDHQGAKLNEGGVIPRRSSKHTNDSSEDLAQHQGVSDDLPPPSTSNTTSKQVGQRSSRSNRGRYTPTDEPSYLQQERRVSDKNRRHETSTTSRNDNSSGRRPTGSGRVDYGGEGRRGRGGEHRRRNRTEDSESDRDGEGGISGEEEGNRRAAASGEAQRRRRRKPGENEAYGRDGRRHKGDDRGDKYHRGVDEPRSSYYRSTNKRRDDYDDYDEDLNASRASSRSELAPDAYSRGGDRDIDRDTRRRRRGERDRVGEAIRDGREKQQGRGYGGGGGGRRGDPYGGAAYMQGYYDPYGHSTAHTSHPYYYHQQYQYYENLRITNPQAYAEWYRKFYQGQKQHSGVNTAAAAQQQGSQRGLNTAVGSTVAEDRASLHSGRSSANDDLAKERQDYTDSSNLNATFQPIDTSSTSLSHYGLPTHPQTKIAQPRLTPAKFSTSHAIASLNSATGQLLHVPVQYPQHGEGAIVHLVSLGEIFGEDGEYGEMLRFPGPLVRGVTHKKTVIEYCEEKIRTAREDIAVDCDSYILLWELLILLLSHNGVVVGADISDLLMRHNRQQQLEQNIRPASVNSNTSSNACIDQNSNSETSNINVTSDNKLGNAVGLKEDAITNKFRQYLIYGSVKEALEWAMKNGLWGHALFLASKLDKRTYANVMKRFANGLPINDPLQTLYQLLSGSIPAAVTCVAEERWGDWRPHLAMILANSTSNPELDRRSILSLGDTLDVRGSIYAAQFCYLMAQVEFSGGPLTLSAGATETDRLVLLGGDKRTLGGNIRKYATTEAIHMTEVYEYASGLNGDGFFIPAFQTYKYLLATRLCDHGLVERSLAYLERIATILIANSSTDQNSQNTSTLTGTSSTTNMFHPVFVSKVCQLADRLRYCDPTDELQQEGEDGEGSNGWLERLMKLDRDYSMGLISHSAAQIQEMPDNNQQQHYIGNTEDLQQQSSQQQSNWQQDPNQQYFDPSVNYQQQQIGLDQTLTEGQGDYNQPQAFWTNQPQQLSSYNSPVSSDLQDQLASPDSLHWNTQTEDVTQQQQQISMPNQSSRKAYDDMDDGNPKSLQDSSGKAKSSQLTTKTAAKNENKGWLDGIFGRFSMRPKNQMKLPDDKNPTIVWDPVKKRWMNTEEDGGDTSSELRPPPKMAELIPQQPMSLPSISMMTQAQHQNGGSNMAAQTVTAQTQMSDVNAVITGKPPIPGGNMFKMQRSRNLKKSYVDVFNPGGISGSGGSAPALIDGASNIANTASSGVVPNFFIPQPVADQNAPMDFLTPTTGMPSIDHQQQLRSRSRCSSPASSLSREVTHYMATVQPLTSQRRLTSPTKRSPVSFHSRY